MGVQNECCTLIFEDNSFEISIFGTCIRLHFQVHPYKLTHAYFNQAQKLAGTSLHKGVVEGIEISDDRSKVTGVKVKSIVCTIVAVTPCC